MATATPVQGSYVEPDRNGVSVAPIHGDSLSLTVTHKTPWPAERAPLEVLSKTLYVAWDGRVKTPKGHPFPMLYATIELAVPAGAGLVTQSDKPLRAHHLAADDRDVYSFDLPIRKLEGNSAEFFLKLGASDPTPRTFWLRLRRHADDKAAARHAGAARAARGDAPGADPQKSAHWRDARDRRNQERELRDHLRVRGAPRLEARSGAGARCLLL
ncbi:MAG: hypothetical protein HY075_06965 [Deltaproteobacteria bacterium]|nr:hypothetical protein [Deltaproteobacteria bacterium]